MAVGRKRKRHEHEQAQEQDASNLDVLDPVGVHGLVRRDLLQHAYTTVLTLREYALLKLPSSSRLRRKKINHLGKENSVPELEATISKFLDSTLICGSDPIVQSNHATYEQWLSFSQKGDESHVTISGGISGPENMQSELVDFAVWSLFNREKKPGAWPKHLLCDGFRKKTREGDPNGTSIPDVYSLYPNHHAAALKQEPWPHVLALLGRSGQNIMIDLLVEGSIFVTVEAGIGNYYQISGVPLSDIDLGGSSSNPSVPRKLSDISLVRSRIFYAKPALTARGRVQSGFKHIHVLNRCPASKDDGTEERTRIRDANTTKVAMYMFPRQFGLHNVFTSHVNLSETAQRFQDYTLREDEIKSFVANAKNCSKDGTPKLPKRLRGAAWNLVRRLQVLHGQCSYGELLRHYCHLKIDSRRPPAASLPVGGRSLTRTSERTQATGQRSAEVASYTPGQTRYSQPHRDVLQCNSLVDLATSTSQVSALCQAVLSNLVPNEFWGKGETMYHNKAIVLRKVDHFIKLRRFEAMTLHEICQGMKIADIPWLQLPGSSSPKASQTERNKQNEIFHELLYYIFDSLLIPFVRANFYVTESNTHRYQVFYFRHEVWRRIAEPALSLLKADMFQELKLTEANGILDGRRLGFSQVRLLPKGSKLRPIMNLRRRQVSRTGAKALKPSINSVLGPIHTAFKFEKITNPQKLGSTLFSVSDMYARLKKFKTSLPSKPHRFYFAKLDVQSAFDTIPQDAIVQLMKSVPTQRQYTITKHAEVQPGERAMIAPEKTATKPIRRWHASALVHAGQSFTERLHNGLASKRKHTVFVDGVAQRYHDVNSLLCLLDDHIERNLVKIGKKYYRQKRGIPQGSVLSSFLCNYFYADLESNHLDFLHTPDCLLMRLIDDFLLITLDKRKAVRFVETMHQGLPEYGVQVSPPKTLVNFDMRIDGQPVGKTTQPSFPYCGTRINDQTLDITKDGETTLPTSHSLTVEYGRSAGQNFQRKILNAFKIQSHLMFFDTLHNAPRTVLDSLRGAFVETARKMWAYIRCLPKTQRPCTGLITRTIAKVADVAFSILSSKSRRLRCPEYSCCIRKGQVNCAAYGAFLEVLGTKQANYGPVIAWLKKQDKRLSAMQCV